jgi:hypothetical protein
VTICGLLWNVGSSVFWNVGKCFPRGMDSCYKRLEFSWKLLCFGYKITYTWVSVIFLITLYGLKLHISVKHENKECKYYDSWSSLCCSNIFIFKTCYYGEAFTFISPLPHKVFLSLTANVVLQFWCCKWNQKLWSKLHLNIFTYTQAYWPIYSLLHSYVRIPAKKKVTSVYLKNPRICNWGISFV